MSGNAKSRSTSKTEQTKHYVSTYCILKVEFASEQNSLLTLIIC